jgi:hypothetical protein
MGKASWVRFIAFAAPVRSASGDRAGMARATISGGMTGSASVSGILRMGDRPRPDRSAGTTIMRIVKDLAENQQSTVFKVATQWGKRK